MVFLKDEKIIIKPMTCVACDMPDVSIYLESQNQGGQDRKTVSS